MCIICPNCSTRYRIKPTALGEEGRTVKCSSCEHRWFVAPPEPQELELDQRASPAEPAPLEEPKPAPPEPAASQRSTLVPWLLTAVVLLVLTGFVLGRNQIVASFPTMEPFYERIGLPLVLESGLEIRDLDRRREEQDGVPVLIVTGEVHNVAQNERSVPPVRVSLIDAADQEVGSGTFSVGEEVLPAGAISSFEARFENPSEQARSVRVTLDQDSDAQ